MTISPVEATAPRSAHHTTVLIVGAGPTGLVLANVLLRYGIAVRVIEKRTALSRHTKATNLMQRTQELLDSVDLLDPVRRIGGAMSGLTVSAYGTSLGRRTMHLRETTFPDVILCGQHVVEAVAAERLARLGTRVEFGVELVGLTQDPDGATAHVVRDGAAELIRADYVVGADGRAGVARTFTVLDFAPVRTGVAIRQVDCTLRWHRSSTIEQMWMFYVDHGFGVVVPLPGGVHRVLLIEPKNTFPDREPTLAEMQTKLREVADDPTLELSDLRWASYTDLAMGIAPALIDGRVILAGDAGNPILPNGGQGMNTGIGDAFNLGWKLAAVLRDGAPAELLETYNAERHQLRTTMERTQYNSLKFTTLVTPRLVRAAIRRFGGVALDLGAEYKIAQAFSELTITTRRSPLSTDVMRGRGVRAGDRALDAPLVRGFDTLHLRELLYDGGWTLLVFTGRGRRADLGAASAAARAVRSDINVHLVTTTTSEAAGDLDVLHDLDGEAHRRYRITKPTVLLVRPDGHVAVRAAPRQIPTAAGLPPAMGPRDQPAIRPPARRDSKRISRGRREVGGLTARGQRSGSNRRSEYLLEGPRESARRCTLRLHVDDQPGRSGEPSSDDQPLEVTRAKAHIRLLRCTSSRCTTTRPGIPRASAPQDSAAARSSTAADTQRIELGDVSFIRVAGDRS